MLGKDVYTEAEAIRSEIACVSQHISIDTHLSLEENIKRSRPLREHLSMDDTFARLYKVARRLEGLKRHTTIHAAGIVMCRKPLDEVIPLYQSREDFYLTGYSMKYLEVQMIQ